MPKQTTLRDGIDDALRQVYIGDFSGGLNSEIDPQDCPLNTSVDCQNVKVTKTGRLIGRGGHAVRYELPADPDGIAFFYDSNGARHEPTFANGNLYDGIALSANLIQSNVYTPGNRVTAIALNNKLYFSDGETIYSNPSGSSGVWEWDPTDSCELLISSGTAGTIDTPAAKVLATYAGSLILANVRYVDTLAYAKHAVLWSNVNDPTTIVGTNIFQVGQGQGGEINCVVPMSVTSTGVSPYSALFVGKSQMGVYHLKGALSVSTLQEVLINAPTGVRDGATVQFIPGPDSAGYIVWLGTDNKVWYTNGVQSGELSQPIRTELSNYIQTRFDEDVYAKFTSGRNFNSFQYVLDVGGGRQYCYDWDLKVWTRYSGWPSGYWCEAKGGNGQSELHVADTSNARVCIVDVGPTDDGANIDPYWKTGYISAGDPDTLKIWHWIYLAFQTDQANIDVTAQVNLGEGQSTTKTLTVSDGSSGGAIWDSAIWDSAVWGDTFATYTKYKKRARLTVQTSGLDGSKELLNGYDIQLTFRPEYDGLERATANLTLAEMSVFAPDATVSFASTEAVIVGRAGVNSCLQIVSGGSIYALVCQSGYSETKVIKISPSDGTVTATSSVYTNPGALLGLMQSPDGTKLYFVYEDASNYNIVGLNASDLTEFASAVVVASINGSVYDYAISDDGTTIALIRSAPLLAQKLEVMDASTLTTTTVAMGTTQLGQVAFKKGSNSIVYITKAVSDNSIYEYNTSGALITTHNLGITSPGQIWLMEVNPSTGYIFGTMQSPNRAFVYSPGAATLLTSQDIDAIQSTDSDVLVFDSANPSIAYLQWLAGGSNSPIIKFDTAGTVTQLAMTSLSPDHFAVGMALDVSNQWVYVASRYNADDSLVIYTFEAP